MAGVLAPSVLSVNFKCLEKQLRELEEAGIKRIHIDMMDGVFVPNLSLGFPVIEAVRSCTDMEFDVHFMIENPEKFIVNAASAGADFITVHQEACRHLFRTVRKVKDAGCRVGVALNPATSLETLRYVLPEIDQVLLMTVNPGFGGQNFLPGMKKKIIACRALIQDMGCGAQIELDGGITIENAAECIRCGADILVAGSSVFHGNMQDNVEQFQKILKQGAGGC